MKSNILYIGNIKLRNNLGAKSWSFTVYYVHVFTLSFLLQLYIYMFIKFVYVSNLNKIILFKYFLFVIIQR